MLNDSASLPTFRYLNSSSVNATLTPTTTTIQPYKAWSQGGQLQGLQRIQPQSYIQLPSRLSFIPIIQMAFNWVSLLWLYMKPLIRREAINQPMKFSIVFSTDTMLQEVQVQEATRTIPILYDKILTQHPCYKLICQAICLLLKMGCPIYCHGWAQDRGLKHAAS